jgi:hypothetical protein
MTQESFSSSEPNRPILLDDVALEIDFRAKCAVQKLTDELTKTGGIELLVERYTPFRMPERVHSAIDQILSLPNQTKYDLRYDHDKRVLRDGLVTGFIVGRRMIKRAQYPTMTNYQYGVLQGVIQSASISGIEPQDFNFPRNAFNDSIRLKLEESEILKASYPVETDVFRSEIFLRASSYLGGAAVSFLTAKLTRNIDFETEAYFLANANKLSREIREEHAGRKKPTPLMHLIRRK